MMKLTCNDTLYTYDAYHLLKAFYPDEEIEQQVNEEQESQVRIETDRDSCFCVSLAGEKSELEQMDRISADTEGYLPSNFSTQYNNQGLVRPERRHGPLLHLHGRRLG